ncbi:hypothetical protein [Chryseobacterium defluvii]|uniref:Uncharacterized protein n=1 Tax=Chryseobacterium defluvii TaxID=160396 RepID=A0A495SNI2_9FLAO|nr:hypothetical protein [Chryseobacterium defluvii]RKT01082.1 hypothetical protein BCF58_0293 [Chryseobacterium defluvii]
MRKDQTNNFKFYQFLSDQGYSKETIRDSTGKAFCYNYQKEVAEKTWNAVTIFNNGTFTASSHSGKLEFQKQPLPQSKEEAEKILKIIEII